MNTKPNLTKLSKFLSLLLRHQPDRFGLEVDHQGWASLPRVVEIVTSRPNLQWADRSDIEHIARHGTGDGKNRFEIKANGIRALYGHSFDQPISYDPIEPPPTLLHGTAPRALDAIREQGLKPMHRQYVHLSPDRRTAVNVGSRHTPHPVVIIVRARAAHRAGISFYRPDPGLYLSEPIPPQFLDIPTTDRSRE